MSKRKPKELTEAELDAILNVDHTVSVTFTGDEYVNVMILAERRDIPVDAYLKALVKEEFRELATLASASREISALEKESRALIKKRDRAAKAKKRTSGGSRKSR